MLIGVPKEIKTQEYRVGLVPSSVKELVRAGHQILVETGAGSQIGFSDDLYIEAGAKIAGNAKEVFDKAEMIVKVKEPQPQEIKMLRDGQVLFTYLHLAADPEQAKGLMASGAVKEDPITARIAAVSCGIYKGTPVLDLDYIEDSNADADANFVLIEGGQIAEVQATAEGATYDEEGLLRLLRLARMGTDKIFAAQADAVK